MAGVHNGNSDDILSICTYSLTLGLCYTMHVRRYILLANICNEYARGSPAYLKYDFLLNTLIILFPPFSQAEICAKKLEPI